MAPRLTTSSYAVLGLLALRPWSAYDLAQQAARSLRFAWPTSERHLYAEPKKLVALGYATMTEEVAGSTRTRKMYTITDAGARALADWSDTEPTPPTFEAETMLRLLFAEHGTVDDLTRAITKLKNDTEELHRWSLSIIEGYARGDAPFPDRLHLSVLLASFELELFTMIERWADFAIDEVSRWESTARPGPIARTDEITSLLAARRTVLDTPDADGDAESAS
jgi:DNA-binding PadR family transcriptional regulator